MIKFGVLMQLISNDCLGIVFRFLSYKDIDNVQLVNSQFCRKTNRVACNILLNKTTDLMHEINHELCHEQSERIDYTEKTLNQFMIDIKEIQDMENIVERYENSKENILFFAKLINKARKTIAIIDKYLQISTNRFLEKGRKAILTNNCKIYFASNRGKALAFNCFYADGKLYLSVPITHPATKLKTAKDIALPNLNRDWTKICSRKDEEESLQEQEQCVFPSYLSSITRTKILEVSNEKGVVSLKRTNENYNFRVLIQR